MSPETKGESVVRAFVLAGGGSLGAVEVGMLRALEAAGVRPDLVVGSSVGAINSVFYAADPTRDGIGRLERIWRGLRRQDVFPVAVAGLTLGLLGRNGHLLSPAALGRLLRHNLPVKWLEDTTIPVCVIATDILRGSEVRLSSGPAVPALLASAAIPGLFPPVRIGDRLLVDGGVANHTPISTAIALGATHVVVLPAGFPCMRADVPRGAVAIALHALNIMSAHHLAKDVDRHRGEAHIAVVPPLCPLSMSAYDFAGGSEVIDRAAETTSAWLGAGGMEMESSGAMIAPHHHL